VLREVSAGDLHMLGWGYKADWAVVEEESFSSCNSDSNSPATAAPIQAEVRVEEVL